MELRGVGERDTTRLIGHGAADFGDPVADADDGGLTGGIKVAAAVGIDDPAAFAASGDWKIFAKIAGKKRRGVVCGAHSKIVAEGAERRVMARMGGRDKLDGSGEGVGYSFAGWEEELANEIICADCAAFGDGESIRRAWSARANRGRSSKN